MSGGVDSSVAAALLLEQGYDVVGVTMRLWTEEDPEAPRHHRNCCSVEDTDDARAACDQLGVRPRAYSRTKLSTTPAANSRSKFST